MIKNIIFDFDGVILDSVPVKTEAFRKLFKEFSKDEVNELIKYHLINGGKSRFLKIKYFFNEVLNKKINDEKISLYAHRYSELTKEELSKEKYLISDTLSFIRENHQKYNMHVASGAEEKDLKYICHNLNLNQYFLSINGSPKVKSDIVKELLNFNTYKKNETILIGDSINDFETADGNGIEFYGYNNKLLKLHHKYITNYTEFTA
ncbi:MAG TPA: HAD family hydrolase [Arcobacter sp.]|nr:HAD family hydrolase [Arcobacter sp.]